MNHGHGEHHRGASNGAAADSGDLLAGQLLSGREKFLGYIRKRISDTELAEDILQDSLLKAVRSAPDVRDEERLVHWFYRVLQNAITDVYRRKAAEANRMREFKALADGPSFEDERTICECINDLIPTLKPEYADVTKAIELDGDDPAAVAKRLGITRNNLKVRTHRARQALRKRLDETCRICAAHHCIDCTCK